MCTLLQRLADVRSRNSLSTKMRRKRFRLFLRLIEGSSKRPLQILDIGGEEDFWRNMDFNDPTCHITLLNLRTYHCSMANMTSVLGDARAMPQFADRQFDIAFSNSVIEHVGAFEDKFEMAQEIRRVSNAYFVQTPNYWFPIEPHFLVPFFHWIPRTIRKWLLCHYSLGWIEKAQTSADAERILLEHTLLTASELKQLFPDASIIRERFIGLAKSLIAVREAGGKGDNRGASSLENSEMP